MLCFLFVKSILNIELSVVTYGGEIKPYLK
uniref:Uncharacterized protein n=1 Tax=Aegilops tauschii subsp. strangulata TaxID=200361 RepID=A0A452ZUK8_AEGTS